MSHSYRKIHSINIDDFIIDLTSSELITNPPSDLPDLLTLYNSTLSSILDKHAPLITKQFTSRKSNPWITPAILALKSARRKMERIYNSTRSLLDKQILNTATNHYNKVIASAKKCYHSNLVQSSASNPRELWKTINTLLHRNKTSPLPSPATFPTASLAQSFASFFTDKIAKIHLTFSLTPTRTDPHFKPPQQPPALTSFQPTTTDEITKLINQSPNKQCELDPIPTHLLKQIIPTVIQTITNIVNLSLSTGIFPSQFKHSVVQPLLKKNIPG